MAACRHRSSTSRALVALGVPVLTADYDVWLHIDDIAAFNAAVEAQGLVPSRTPRRRTAEAETSSRTTSVSTFLSPARYPPSLRAPRLPALARRDAVRRAVVAGRTSQTRTI